jgi:uncharacterized protein (TIGR03382 family)
MVFLLGIIAISGCLKSGEDYTQLSIDTIDISASHVRSSYVDFNVTTYIENYGKIASKNTSIVLKAYDGQNGLLQKQIRAPIGSIRIGSTACISQSLELPRKGGYSIQINLYEGDTRKTTRSISVSNLESLPADVKNIGIEIGEMDFLVRNASNKKVVIENDIYFTNEGADNSSEFDVLVKARERDAQLIADKKWLKLGSIKPEKTVIRSVNLTVPDQYNYVVEVLVWSNNTVVKRGEGAVLLSPQVKLAEGERIESRSIDSGGFKTTAKSAETPRNATAFEYSGPKQPGFTILLALMALAMVGLLRRRKYGR